MDDDEEILNLIDEEAAGITDEEIEERLQTFLRGVKNLNHTAPPAMRATDAATVADALAGDQVTVFLPPCLELSPMRATGYTVRLNYPDVHPIHWKGSGDR